MQKHGCVFWLIASFSIFPSQDIESTLRIDPRSTESQVLPETGRVVIPQGPNYFEPESQHTLVPISPDSMLDTSSGRVLLAPERDP